MRKSDDWDSPDSLFLIGASGIRLVAFRTSGAASLNPGDSRPLSRLRSFLPHHHPLARSGCGLPSTP